MPISVNPTVPVITAQGAVSGVVLQPGTVINAQVLKILADNLVQIAIANLSIDVLSEIPLQAGQNLQLAVSQTPDGIRLAVVGQGAAAENAAGEGAAMASVVPEGEQNERPRNDEFSDRGPIIWLIRNKIDLFLAAGQRTEYKVPKFITSEAAFDPNRALGNMVNKGLTHRNESEAVSSEYEFNISAVTGDGFDRLLDQLARQAETFLAGAEQAVVTRARHRRALEEVVAALERAQAGEVAAREDLLAEELRIAARALGRLTGRVDVEDVLDVIFRDFCIGK